MLVIGLTSGTIMHENVIFQKLNEVTITRSKWLITFVIDLKPYRTFIDRCRSNIDDVGLMARQIINRYHSDKLDGIKSLYVKLENKITGLNDSVDIITDNFDEYNRLQTRHKRSLLPFVGKALSFLFGTVSSADLDSIKRNIRKLAKNQDSIVHVVESGLSMLNTSRIQISDNRNSINSIIDDLRVIDEKIANISAALEKRLAEFEWATKTYLQLDLITAEISDMLQTLTAYLEHLHIQLNMLSLGHLSPSTITPHKLQALLREVMTRLPHRFKLSNNPETELWNFYKSLTCNTILYEEQILVITPIPLLDTQGTFELYKAHNMPLPMMANEYGITDKDISNMVVKYKLETEVLALNAQRTKYALLQPSELPACTNMVTGYCHIQSPVYPINLSQLCIVALFMQNKAKIKQVCRTEVTPQAILPQAEYLTNGQWVVSCNEKLRLSIVCESMVPETHTVVITPPIGVVKLNMTCSASHDRMTLPPYYHNESKYTADDLFLKIAKNTNVSDMLLWKPFYETIKKFNVTKFPDKLKKIETFSMNHLVDQLSNLSEIENMDAKPKWFYAFGLGGLIAVLILMSIIYTKLLRPWFAKRRVRRSIRYASVAPELEMVPVNTAGGEYAQGGYFPSVPSNGRGEMVPVNADSGDYARVGSSPSAPFNGRDETVQGGSARSTIRRLYPGLDGQA